MVTYYIKFADAIIVGFVIGLVCGLLHTAKYNNKTSVLSGRVLVFYFIASKKLNNLLIKGNDATNRLFDLLIFRFFKVQGL